MKYLSSKIDLLLRSEECAQLIASSKIFSTFVYTKDGIDAGDRLTLAKKYLKTESKPSLWKSHLFDLEFYKSNLKRKKIRGVGNYLYHYLKFGWKMNLSPNKLIHIDFYKKQASIKHINIDCEIFEHYETSGYINNLSPSMFFDNDWYRKVNKTDKQNITPFAHFLLSGSNLKLSPTFCFSVSHIESETGTSLPTTIDALQLYIDAHIKSSPINPHILFDEFFYRTVYPDVTQSKMTSVEHFTHYGIWEGRRTNNFSSNKADLTSKADSEFFVNIDKTSRFELKDLFFYYNHLDGIRNFRSDLSVRDHNSRHRPLAIITTFNDADCIRSILLANIREGLSVWLIDNWSTDGTWEIIQSLLQDSHLSTYIEGTERYPTTGASQHYDWSGMLGRKEKIAENFVGRWILHQDSDEITVSPVANITCAECLFRIEDRGFNTVNMRMFDFRPVDSGEPGDDIEVSFPYFEFSKNVSYGLQIKAWIQPTGQVDLKSHGGHRVEFKDSNVFPLRLPRKHYSIRSVAHGRRKVFAERKPRFERERLEKGWHTHYDQEISDKDFIKDKSTLYNYSISGHTANWFDMLLHKDD
ncbi:MULTISPECIES: glycosyltransferase [Methylobacterium]|uniref:glycosyltransferase n=1 Tax=Methylobacterium TaxID=407 RepID=UPI0009E778D7|nr:MULTISPECIES: glycosyltransferase family 2 protein [Methylobacterium]MCI9882918.1 glycosyltransferase family 2 protein [Methylobacterium goesingense]